MEPIAFNCYLSLNLIKQLLLDLKRQQFPSQLPVAMPFLLSLFFFGWFLIVYVEREK